MKTIIYEQTKEKIGHLENTSITKIIYDNNSKKFEIIELGSMS